MRLSIPLSLLKINLLERTKYTVSNDCFIHYRNSCSGGDDDAGGSSGAWRRDEDSTEDQGTECQPSSNKVGHLFCHMIWPEIIFGSIGFS